MTDTRTGTNIMNEKKTSYFIEKEKIIIDKTEFEGRLYQVDRYFGRFVARYWFVVKD